MKKIISFFSNLLLLAASLIFFIFIGEILCRTYDKCVRGIPFNQSTKLLYDQELGWKGKPAFGNPAAQKYKIFVIGDSFTDGCRVEEQYMYYNCWGKPCTPKYSLTAAWGMERCKNILSWTNILPPSSRI